MCIGLPLGISEVFHIHADASDLQLGGVILQNGRPLAFYTRQLNAAQKNYSTGEQELLSIVEILKELRFIEQLRHLLLAVGNLQCYHVRLRSPSCGGLAPESKNPSRGLVGFRQELEVICEIAQCAAS